MTSSLWTRDANLAPATLQWQQLSSTTGLDRCLKVNLCKFSRHIDYDYHWPTSRKHNKLLFLSFRNTLDKAKLHRPLANHNSRLRILKSAERFLNSSMEEIACWRHVSSLTNSVDWNHSVIECVAAHVALFSVSREAVLIQQACLIE